MTRWKISFGVFFPPTPFVVFRVWIPNWAFGVQAKWKNELANGSLELSSRCQDFFSLSTILKMCPGNKVVLCVEISSLARSENIKNNRHFLPKLFCYCLDTSFFPNVLKFLQQIPLLQFDIQWNVERQLYQLIKCIQSTIRSFFNYKTSMFNGVSVPALQFSVATLIRQSF